MSSSVSKQNPEVSVIIPTYNRVELLPRAIQSVLNQTYKSYELIVVDDGSDDDTENLMRSKFPWVKYYQIENNGVSRARNFGVEKAVGKYIAFLDSDDEWLPKKLERQMDLFCEGIRWVHGEERWIRRE